MLRLCTVFVILFILNVTTAQENATSSNYDDIKNNWRYLYIFSGFLSVFALGLTLFNYALTPGMKSLNGWCLKFHALFLLIAFLIESIQEILRNFCPKLYYWENCFSVEYIFVFSFLSCFMWLQILSFDIWRAFRVTNSTNRDVMTTSLIRYSLFAFCPPIIVVIISASFRAQEVHEKINCWIDNELWTFTITVPVSLIVLINLFFCISTAVKIRNLKKETAETWQNSESRPHSNDKLRFNLYVKLFSVMGGTWIIWITVQFYEVHAHVERAFNYHLYGLFDCIYNAQGVMVYITTVLTTPNRTVILQRLRKSKYFVNKNATGSVTPTASSNL